MLPRYSAHLLIFTLFASNLLSPPVASAVEWITTGCIVNNIITLGCVEAVVQNLLSVILGFIGLAAFIMVIIASFQLLTSGGDPKKTELAQKTLTYSIGGLFGIFLVWFVLIFLERFADVDLSNFNFSL